MTAKPRIMAIMQARMGSSRLPGKIIAEIAGRPMLNVIIDRLGRSKLMDELVIASSERPANQVVEDLAAKAGVRCFRGSEDDVLDRFYQAARLGKPDIIVRLTADNPCMNGEWMDFLIEQALAGKWDYFAPSFQTHPHGVSAEIFPFACLETMWKEATHPEEREHVTPFLYRRPDRFRVCWHESAENNSDLRLTVDTEDDLRLAREIFDHFGHDQFTWQEAAQAIRNHPEWRDLNRHVHQKIVSHRVQ
ncbi:cytidylyltransferase domain-containing protein [Zavarzinella formosa]|uniref:cytidylyltransferase domain-containing protein n=1 Tax=Zavarzinella formosa TaxID=360055 RepID=UPI0002D4BE2C|nr:glycosyltransferase family protein [Zavarzinella formosa]